MKEKLLEKCFIGVDAGGTKTTIQAFTLNQQVITSIQLGVGSFANSLKEALHNIENGVRIVYNDVKNDYHVSYIVIGVSGLGAYSEVEKLHKEYEQQFNCPVEITSDTRVALYSITKGETSSGIIVLAGTGVAIFGQKGNQTQMIGGWGYLLHERGSAYAVVRNIILSAISHYEKGKPFTELEIALLNEMGVTQVADVKPLFYQQNHKEKIAQHAKFIKERAHQGDLQAVEELKQAGRDLAEQVHDCVNLLKLEPGTLLGHRGGFFTDGELIFQGFNEYLMKHDLHFTIVKPEANPIIGAYYLALEGYQKELKKL
ncbi:MAG: BadF/BadG/BcrA/BcrD ATPase family protein [Bacilli bacterium]|nr:BadF/BadG/BcrA/BcrD ATPase family protein [Bacilli bacterium]HHU24853.1 hypothetical protein [Acholeplasmataceae bacterium]